MFLWTSYEKFASATELHGFDQVLKYSKFWAAVWICLTVAACCFCVNDVVNLTITYQSQPTLIDLSLQSNMDLSPPNPTLCMEVNVDSVNMNAYSRNNTYTVEQLDADLSAFLLATQNGENLNISDRDKLHLTDNLQFFTYLMLSHITEAETLYIGYDNSVLTSFVTQHSGIWSIYTQSTNTINRNIGYLYQQYTDRKVSLANLKRLIGMSICQQRTDILTKRNSTHTISGRICKPHTITHLSFSTVCSKLLDNSTDELANYNTIMLNGTRVSQVDSPFSDSPYGTGSTCSYSSPQITFSWHLDFQGRPMLPVGSRQDVYSWDPYACRSFDLTVATEYNFHSTNRDPCQSVQWQYDCEFNRRIALMENKCGCRPSSLLYGAVNDKIPACSENSLKPVWKYSNGTTADNQPNLDFDGICALQIVDDLTKNACVRDCHLFTFDIQYAQPSFRVKPGMAPMVNGIPMLPSGVVMFNVNMAKKRQFVVETAAKSFGTFICDFGGTIGAWLGASLLAFVHAVIHIALTLCNIGKQLREKRPSGSRKKT